jgi:molybdopterin-containing oxidoreductase family iron-sulfur binding subunit
VVKDLQAHAGRCLVMAGPWQPAAVHALAHAANQRLGNVGQTVSYAPSWKRAPIDQTASLRDLAAAMDAGQVQVLVVLGGNPVYDAPADLEFARRMEKVPLRIHHGLYEDETAERCHWHVPAAHPLEAWSDARAFDGTVTIVQPLIAPLYAGCKSAHEVWPRSRPSRSARATTSSAIIGRHKACSDPTRRPGSARCTTASWRRRPSAGWQARVRRSLPPRLRHSRLRQRRKASRSSFRPDASVRDGRFANNGWLQELPRPLSKLTWDNAALMSPRTAESLGISVESTSLGHVHGRRRAALPRAVGEGPGLDRSRASRTAPVTVHLGYGRTRAGRVGTGVGFNAYALRTSDAPWFGGGLEVQEDG